MELEVCRVHVCLSKAMLSSFVYVIEKEGDHQLNRLKMEMGKFKIRVRTFSY